MMSKCLLETDGYRIAFELNPLATKKYVDLVVDFILDSRISGFAVRSIPTYLAISDLKRLVSYFEEHIAKLQQDPDSESYTFVPMEMAFQVQALAGDILSEDEGEFTLRFMVNVGRSHEEDATVYVGGETAVTLANIKRFIASLRAALVGFSLSVPLYSNNYHQHAYVSPNLVPASTVH